MWRTSLLTLDQVAVFGKLSGDWWRVVTATFTYDNTGYAFATLFTIALYGSLIERRHGPATVLVLFAIGGIGGVAASAVVYDFPFALGANGAALALLIAWAIPDLLALRSGEEIDGDMLGTAALALVVGLMPLVVKEASWVAAASGCSPACCSASRWRGCWRAEAPAAAQTTLIEPAGPSTRRPIDATGNRLSACRSDRGEQATGRHRVAQQPPARLGHVVGERRELLGVGAVAAGAAGDR